MQTTYQVQDPIAVQDSFFPLKQKPLLWGVAGVLLVTFAVGLLAAHRNYFTFSTETDYLDTFIKEAERFQKGSALELQFHPPLYSIVLSIVERAVHDWLITGLLISWVSCLVILAGCFLLFYQLGGPYAAWGSLIALATSSNFLTYSAFASSDVFFLAFYYLSFLLALSAFRRKTTVLWGTTGITLGFCLLTRSNALSLLPLLVLPFLQDGPRKIRLANARWLLLGAAVPLTLWAIDARLTGTPFLPTSNHLNLAQTYFSKGGYDRVSGEYSQTYLSQHFKSVKDVLRHDPRLIAVTYVKDLVTTVRRFFGNDVLVIFPVNLFALPGLLLIIGQLSGSRFNRKLYGIVFLVATGLQILLVNFKAFENRYYLFLVPVFGAGMGSFVKEAMKELNSKPLRVAVWTFLIFFITLGARDSYIKTKEHLHSRDQELREAIGECKKVVSANCSVVARRPHLPYYLGCNHIFIPPVSDLEELRTTVCRNQTPGEIYLYYGSDEIKRWTGLAQLQFPENSPQWLVPVALSETRGDWVLYKFRAD